MNNTEYKDLIDRLASERTGEAVLNSSPEHASIINERMFHHAESSVDIITRRFDPRIFGNEDFLKSVALFAGQSDRKARIAIEEISAEDLRAHPFVKIMEGRNNIEIKIVPEILRKAVDFNCSIMDGTSYRFEKDKKQAVAIAAFSNDDEFAGALLRTFELVWKHSENALKHHDIDVHELN